MVALASSARAAGALPAAGDYQVDAAGSSVTFKVTNVLVMSVDGRFSVFTGHVTVGDSLAASRIEASADVRSISTGNDRRDDHLRSQDFFDVARFPRMTFVSTQIWGAPERFGIRGKLTIHGVTREVVFGARILDSGVIEATATVDRTAFGITYGPTIKNEVRVHLQIRLARAASTDAGAP